MGNRIIWTIISVILWIPLICCTNDGSQSFEELMVIVDSLEADSSFVEAKAFIEANWSSGDHEFERLQELVYLNEKLLLYEDNLAIWDSGHVKDFFFLIHPDLPRFRPYTGFTNFMQIAQRNQLLRAEAIQQARTTWEILPPLRKDVEKTYPAVFIFHGGGSSLQKARARWKFSDSFRDSTIIVYFQSYRNYTSNTYGWRTGDQRGLMELDSCFRDILTQYPIDETQITLSGISAGASIAIDVGLRGTIPSARVVAFCPGYPRDVFKDSLVIPDPPFIEIIAGETDFYGDPQVTLCESLERLEISYSYRIIEGLDHDLPGDYEEFIYTAMFSGN